MNSATRRTLTCLASAVVALGAGSPAIASNTNATPDENGRLETRLAVLTGVHTGATINGIFTPGPLGVAWEMTAISTDVAAKHTAPSFSLPAKTGNYFEQFPDEPETPPPGQSVPIGAHNCVYRFTGNTPRLDDNNSSGISEEYASIFGIEYDGLDNVFSYLGRPSVWHPQADVVVSANNTYLGSPRTELQQNPEFPEGWKNQLSSL